MKNNEIPKGTSTTNIDILLYRVIKLLSRSKKQILDNSGLTHSQFEILSAIHCFTVSSQEIIQIALFEKTGIDPMTTSTILRNLEKKKLVTRMRGIENTHAVYIELTPFGQEIYQHAFVNKISLNESLYTKIDKNNLSEQLLLLTDELTKLNN